MPAKCAGIATMPPVTISAASATLDMSFCQMGSAGHSLVKWAMALNAKNAKTCSFALRMANVLPATLASLSLLMDCAPHRLVRVDPRMPVTLVAWATSVRNASQDSSSLRPLLASLTVAGQEASLECIMLFLRMARIFHC